MNLPSEHDDDDRYDGGQEDKRAENGQRNDADHVEFGFRAGGFARQRIDAIFLAVFGHNRRHLMMIVGIFVRYMADLFVVQVLVVVAQIVAGGRWCDAVRWLNGRAGRLEFVCGRLFGGGGEN